MTGYANDYSMSNNAKQAYSNGSMPISKWNKKMIVEELITQANNASNYLKESYEFIQDVESFKNMLLKMNLNELKKLLEKDGWHHTSKCYNETNFYKVNLEIACDYIYQNYEE